jgi:hypothetical protein
MVECHLSTVYAKVLEDDIAGCWSSASLQIVFYCIGSLHFRIDKVGDRASSWSRWASRETNVLWPFTVDSKLR